MGPLAALWGLSGADHFAIGLPQRDSRLRGEVHRISRLHGKSLDKGILVAQRAVGTELPRRVRIDLEALDARGIAGLLAPDLREADEQPLLAGIAVDDGRRTAVARQPVGPPRDPKPGLVGDVLR